jgi:hypothetical protein
MTSFIGTLPPNEGDTYKIVAVIRRMVETLKKLTSGQIPGTTTNDNAAAGNVGEYSVHTTTGIGGVTVTISNGSPGVITDAAHGMSIGGVVNFTTSGGLPTGLVVGTNYYVSSQGFTTGSYSVSTSIANAFAGTSINTSSAGSGNHARNAYALLTTVTNQDIAAIQLSAGDWDVNGWINYNFAASTTVNSIRNTFSSASGTLGDSAEQTVFGFNALALVNSFSVPNGPVRFSLASTTTIYMVARANFGTSTMFAYGRMRARRVR